MIRLLKSLLTKTQRKLYAFYGDTFKWYYCAFGANPVGYKQREGDNRTPEGNYYISLKNPQSRGYRSLKISYPNAQDRAKARKMGVSPGGDNFYSWAMVARSKSRNALDV